MKVVQINAVCGIGSTGKICISVSDVLNQHGIENYILFSAGYSSHPGAISCCSRPYTKFQALKSRLLGNYGFNSAWETRRMIAILEKIQPDIVHLHNIHGHDCHLELLMDYFRSTGTKVFWTFHDCWAFTGYCTHFMFYGCEKWKSGCGDCPQRKKYSWIFDRSAELYQRKKQAFSGLDLTIITPSQWLADLVRQSFLQEYPVKVIHNGIDLKVFQPTSGNFRDRYGIPVDKFLILGVAHGWSERKGLDVFVELERRLDPEKFQIVLVGTSEKIDKKLPKGIISIHRTNCQKDLAEIYTAADLFVNPTREDNYPTVNMEAIACGTPVLTFRTGGSPESLTKEMGCVVDYGDIDAMERETIRMAGNLDFSLFIFHSPHSFSRSSLSQSRGMGNILLCICFGFPLMR